MTMIDRMIALNLIQNGVDPRTATALDRKHARERCEACAKLMGERIEVVAASMCDHFKDDLAKFDY